MEVHRSPRDTALCSILKGNVGCGGGRRRGRGGGNYKLGYGLFRWERFSTKSNTATFENHDRLK